MSWKCKCFDNKFSKIRCLILILSTTQVHSNDMPMYSPNAMQKVGFLYQRFEVMILNFLVQPKHFVHRNKRTQFVVKFVTSHICFSVRVSVISPDCYRVLAWWQYDSQWDMRNGSSWRPSVIAMVSGDTLSVQVSTVFQKPLAILLYSPNDRQIACR